jgi:hypothetical protein
VYLVKRPPIIPNCHVSDLRFTSLSIIDIFDLIDLEMNGVIEKEDYRRFLMCLTNGLVPLGHFEDGLINQMWDSVTEQCGSPILTRENFGQLLCLADLHIYLTISF